MSRTAPRRRAERPSRRRAREARRTVRIQDIPRPVPTEVVVAPAGTAVEIAGDPDRGSAPEVAPDPRDTAQRRRRSSRSRAAWERFSASRAPVVLGLLVVLTGVGALAASLVPVGPAWLGSAGSVAVATAYAWALAARTGGRPLVAGGVALVLGTGVVVGDDDTLRTGAAVLTCVVAAVLAVTATVPAVRFVHAVREVVLALLVAGVGALATVGFEPAATVIRFEYATLALGLVAAFIVVYRLGAGLHGLGRRGVLTVLVGGVVLALTLAYAELLRRYATPGLVDHLLDNVRWSRQHLGAFPRPLEAALGVPALAWGTHMRARRRQGWWVCAFGAAATVPAANALVNPSITMLEGGLSIAYGAVVGLLVGFVVIRLDLAFTGPRGRRGRRAEEATAVRPEPARTRPLL